MIKLVVSDIDGTLLSKDRDISKYTRDTIARLRDSGVEFMLATGRNYESACGIAESLGLDPQGLAIASLNGMRVESPFWNYSVRQESMTYAMCESMEALGKKYFLCILYCYEDIIFYQMDDLSMRDFELGGNEERMRFFNDSLKTQRIESLVELETRFKDEVPILKMVYIQNPDYLELIQERLSQEIDGKHDLLMVGPGWAEIMPKHINKGDAIMAYASSRGYKREEIMAFGDSDNDLTMIKQVGVGVAMANGRKSVKILADDHTVSNEEDGVAVYIEEHLL